jgi:protein-disulfide isomerase
MHRILPRLWAALALMLLAACGATGSAGPTPVATQPTQASPVAQASVAQPPTVVAAPTAGTQPSAPAATMAVAAPTAGQSGIPEGATPEGYHVLGRADAPVTLVMYSDFL